MLIKMWFLLLAILVPAAIATTPHRPIDVPFQNNYAPFMLDRTRITRPIDVPFQNNYSTLLIAQ